MKKPAKDAPREPIDNHSTNGAEWLRAMIEASVDCVITIDAQSTVLEFNAAAERTFGYRRDDVIGKLLTETIIPPSLREGYRRGMAALLKGGTKLLGRRVEMPAMRSDGSEFPVELTVTQIAGQTPPIFTAYLRDITDRIQAAEALNAQALRYKTLMETCTDSIYVLDEKGDLQEANAAFLSRRGYTAEEVKGLNVADWDAQWSREALQERLRMLVGSSAVFETRHRCKDGSLFDVEVCGTSVLIGGEKLLFCVTRDITQRKQAEKQALALIDAIPQQIWSGPPDGTLDYCNARWRSYMGIGLKDLQGDGWQTMLHPNDRERVLMAWRDSVVNGTPFGQEERHLGADGTYRWFLARGVPLRDTEGRIVRWYGTNTDIEDRKQAEKALNAQGLRYKTLMETSTDSIYVLDENGDLQEANAAFLSRRGYIAAEVKGLNFADWNAQWNREQLQERLRKMVGNSGVFETRHRCKDGSVFDVEVCATSVRIGGEQLFFCVTRDITERKQAADDLRHSEQRFAAFMDNLPGFAWMKDVKGRYVYRNKRMMEIPGFRENWSGKTDADFWPPEVAAQYRANDLKVITSRASLQTVEYHPSVNRGRYLLVSKFPIFDQAGAVTMVAGAGVDVTERIQAEQARAQLAAIVESSNDAIIGQTFEGIITSWNAAAERIYGYTAAEILGQSLALLCPPEIPDPMPALRLRLKRREMIDDFETIRLRKDGSRLHVSVSLSPIKSATGEITGISGISRDITERKRIEKALESAEEQYHSIFNNAVDGIFRTSPDGKFLVANPAAARIFGFASPEELIEERQDIAQQGYVDPRRREEFKRLIQEQDVVNGFEYEAYRKDGSRVWISENTHAVHSPSGEILYFEGIFEDVTERKQAEEALRESEERFRTIFEQAPLGISEGEIAAVRFVNANQRYVAILGYPIDELRTLTFKDYTHPEDLQKDLVEFQKLAAGEIRTYAMEKRYIRKDGAIIWANLTVSALAPPGEKPLNCMAVIEDITERRQAEEALKESEQQMRLFMQATADCLWNWDLITGNVVRSVGFNYAFGYSAQEMDSSVTWWEERLHPDDRGKVFSTFQATVASGGNACSYEYRFRRKDGTYAAISDRAYIVRDAKGKPLRALGAMTDITERKEAEEALQKANRQLRILSRRRAQVQEDERKHLARELHDQIGQALTVTKISVQSAKRSKKREVIARHLDHTMAVLDQILVQVRQMTLDLRPAALDDLGLVPALRLVLHDHARSAGWQMQFLGDANLERADAEVETACFRITLEALTNILRHARARKVSLELCRTADSLHLIVRDDGVGFDLADAEKRVERDRLGLVGMRERATGVGGAFECRSVIGKGTEVHAFLPFSPV